MGQTENDMNTSLEEQMSVEKELNTVCLVYISTSEEYLSDLINLSHYVINLWTQYTMLSIMPGSQTQM